MLSSAGRGVKGGGRFGDAVSMASENVRLSGQHKCHLTARDGTSGHSSHRWRVRIELLARFLPLLERTVLRRQGEPFSDIS